MGNILFFSVNKTNETLLTQFDQKAMLFFCLVLTV